MEEYKSDLNKSRCALFVFSLIGEALMKDHADYVTSGLTIYVCPEIYKIDSLRIDKLFRLAFFHYSSKKKFREGFRFFMQFENLTKTTEYCVIRPYLLYFAYVTQQYSDVEKFIYNFVAPTFAITSYEDMRDFDLYNLYKGMIHIQKREFIFAAFSFLNLTKTMKKLNYRCFDLLQLEGLKRLVLIYPFLDKKFQDFVSSEMKKIEKIKFVNQIDKWYNLFESFKKTKGEACNCFASFINERNIDLKNDNLLGLANYSLIELRFKTIVEELKKYKKISLVKLSNKLNFKVDVVKNILEIYSCQGRIDVKIDEESTTIEVINCEKDSQRKLEELKKYYSYLNNASFDLALLDMTGLADGVNNIRRTEGSNNDEMDRFMGQVSYADAMDLD